MDISIPGLSGGVVGTGTFDSIANGSAFLEAELAFRDPVIREPLTSTSYIRHLPMQSGGGWDEFELADNLDFSESGGANGDTTGAGGHTQAGTIQMNLNRDLWKTHIYDRVLRVSNIDMLRASKLQLAQSLESMLEKGLRIGYDNHANINAYLGWSPLGTTGLVNSAAAGVPVYAAAATGTLNALTWSSKTPLQILTDVNTLLNQVWTNAQFSPRAIPNYCLVPMTDMALLLQPVTLAGYNSVLNYVLSNNIYTVYTGKPLVLEGCPFLSGAAANGISDRMVAYCHDTEFLSLRELEPLSRQQTVFTGTAFETHFLANLGQCKFHSFATIAYMDGV
jgi:hypothetical protein